MMESKHSRRTAVSGQCPTGWRRKTGQHQSSKQSRSIGNAGFSPMFLMGEESVMPVCGRRDEDAS
ncbi:hypothetical protein ACFPVT_04820 [Corynebacterium choanae]|uniref:hypothetical protein n=1 Tax=Corynebacterium choanae TaxID=1862358 RepID=UPI000F510A11|nr:hypothetical protein [Corynebacterium choanae]